MNKPIPLTPAEALAQVNLPADMADNPVFSAHIPLVMTQLHEFSTPDAWEEATAPLEITPLSNPPGKGGIGGISDPDPNPELDPKPEYTILQIQFRAAFAFALLASTAEFLNLKTVGEGIVKTIGIDSAATELLTGSEIEAFTDRLLRRALLAIQPWLSAAGRAALDELTTDNPKPLRISII